ncbi:MAG: DUF309 domain-containing protein [Pseudomonadota bacterium]
MNAAPVNAAPVNAAPVSDAPENAAPGQPPSFERAAPLALPEVWHIPGKTPHPSADHPASRVARTAPNPTDPAHWRDNLAYLYGLRLYHAGFYWEAHEVWEAVWMNARPNSPERHLLQGLIQLANAGLKIRMGKLRAVQRLGTIASGHLADANRAIGAPSPNRDLMGLELTAVRSATANFAEAALRSDAASLSALPPLMPELGRHVRKNAL